MKIDRERRPDSGSRYDAVADWYERTFAGYREGPSATALRRLLAEGSGWCLDVGCGGGLHFPTIKSTGRRVLGIDLSFNQLRIASTRSSDLVQADAARLPFRDDTFATVTSTFTHTDTQAFANLVAEVERVLSPGGTFVYVGTHPCFVGHCVELQDDGVLVRPAYVEAGWHADSPSFRVGGLRARVGEWHMTLAQFLTAFIDSGLVLDLFEEPGGGFGRGLTRAARTSGPPGLVAVVARKP